MKLYSGLAWGIAEHPTLPRAFWAHLFAHRDLDDPRVIVPRHLPGDRAHLQFYQKEILDAKERWEIFRHWCAHRAEFNLSGGDLLLIAGEA